jgi:hypothetical protein
VENKAFSFEFEDHSPRSITYEMSDNEKLKTSVQGGVPFLCANREGMLLLAKLLIQLSLGEYKDGFHVHLRPDFSDDAGKPDSLTIVLDNSQ